jgi:hypothetical protein
MSLSDRRLGGVGGEGSGKHQSDHRDGKEGPDNGAGCEPAIKGALVLPEHAFELAMSVVFIP